MFQGDKTTCLFIRDLLLLVMQLLEILGTPILGILATLLENLLGCLILFPVHQTSIIHSVKIAQTHF